MTDAQHRTFPIVVPQALKPERVASLTAALPKLIDMPPHEGRAASSRSIYWMLRNGLRGPAAAILDAFAESPLNALASELFPDGYTFLVGNCAIRRHQPGNEESHLDYHFDASFIGWTSKMVNFWVPLTALEAGVPGLSFLDYARVEKNIWPKWQGMQTADGTGRRALSVIEDKAIRNVLGDDLGALQLAPKVSPGGALVFDERTLHRTEIVEEPTRQRLSIEYRIAGRDAIPLGYVKRGFPVLDVATVDGRHTFEIRAVSPG